MAFEKEICRNPDVSIQGAFSHGFQPYPATSNILLQKQKSARGEPNFPLHIVEHLSVSSDELRIMKLSNLFLASTALPLMLLPANVSALQPKAAAPIVVAQAGPSAEEELPPGARPRRQGQQDGDGPRRGAPGGCAGTSS